MTDISIPDVGTLCPQHRHSTADPIPGRGRMVPHMGQKGGLLIPSFPNGMLMMRV